MEYIESVTALELICILNVNSLLDYTKYIKLVCVINVPRELNT